MLFGSLLACAAALAQDSLAPRTLDIAPLASFPGYGGKTVVFNPLDPGFSWDEAIVSWNVKNGASGSLKLEARVVNGDRTTKWYTLGLWSLDHQRGLRTSIKGQKDDDGDVLTDTLRINKPGGSLELRAFLLSYGDPTPPELTLLKASFSSRDYKPSEVQLRGSDREALPVPMKSQMSYEDGDRLCSPTALSMLLGYWSERLGRKDLDWDVPQVREGVDDPGWPGAGNWPFNTAFAGSLKGLEAYTARLRGIEDLDGLIREGIPVACSVDGTAIQGKSGPPSGHLVVVVGFTEDGSVIVNDPGWSKEVRQIYKRADFLRGWWNSRFAAYIVHPSGMVLPR